VGIGRIGAAAGIPAGRRARIRGAAASTLKKRRTAFKNRPTGKMGGVKHGFQAGIPAQAGVEE